MINIILYLLIAAGLLIFLSQSSYARIAGSMYGYRDEMTIPRLRSLQKRADLLHCIHHSVHAICGVLMMIISAMILSTQVDLPVLLVSGIACCLLVIDTMTFLYNDIKHHLRIRRDEIKRKWKGEKVFGPEHDNEVSLYRTLKELTTRNIQRDLLHMAAFIVLTILHYC